MSTRPDQHVDAAMRDRGRVWRPSIALLALVILLAALPIVASSAVPDKKPPRIVAAVVQDADGDYRADRVRLTFTERIRHPRDADGTYPFTVVGYTISSIAAARNRSIDIALVERPALDASAKPAIRYRRTVSEPVKDRAGNQAPAQVFKGTRAHGKVPRVPPPSPLPPLPPPPPANLDPDGDGFAVPADCQPNDRAINPRAADMPDLAFVDSNCDGIDGTEANAIFASPLGNDANVGTKAAPKREIGAAVAAAAAAKRYVLAAEGSYERVVAATGVDIYGGYDRTTWARSAARITSVVGAPEGLLAAGATGVLLQHLSVRGLNGGSGSSAYGIRAINGASLTLQRLTVTAGDGAVGAAGANGPSGATGPTGGRGFNGATDGNPDTAPAGDGGNPGENPSVGLRGGRGGDGGFEGASGKAGGAGQVGTPAGPGGANGNPGKNGGDGANGTDGGSGSRGAGGNSSAARASSVWLGADGGVGSPGLFGNGGGGGGGGGGATRLLGTVTGNAGGGGGGGAGGVGGGRGGGGGAGGGSFGVYLYNSTLTAEGSSITSGNGGAGGRGGNGGSGGSGGSGGGGGSEGGWAGFERKSGAGGKGGSGGKGGQGGAGGGGAGGPSIAVMKVGSAATLTNTNVVIGTAGQGGAPGTGGSGAPAGSQSGIAQAIYP